MIRNTQTLHASIFITSESSVHLEASSDLLYLRGEEWIDIKVSLRVEFYPEVNAKIMEFMTRVTDSQNLRAISGYQ